jgi:hypothetical protein
VDPSTIHTTSMGADDGKHPGPQDGDSNGHTISTVAASDSSSIPGSPQHYWRGIFSSNLQFDAVAKGSNIPIFNVDVPGIF